MYFGIICGFLSMIGFGFGNVLSKVPTQKIGPIKTTFIRGIFIVVFLLIITLFIDMPKTFDIYYIVFAILLGIFGYFPLLFFYKAIDKGKVGIIVPITNSASIFTILLAVVFFKESLNLIQILAVVLVFVGMTISSINFKDFRSSDIFKQSSGIVLAILTFFGWGLYFFLSKYPVDVLGPMITAFITEIMIMLVAMIHLKIKKESFFGNLKMDKNLIYLILIGLSSAIGVFFFNLGITKANVSLVSTISRGSILISLIMGYILYKEKLTKQQLVSVFLMLVGLVMISV